MIDVMASIIGSGINGNLILSIEFVEKGARWLLLLEVELMETLTRGDIGRDPFRKWLLLLEVELMETGRFDSSYPKLDLEFMASIIGSGINGNNCFPFNTSDNPPNSWLLLLEVELMETFPAIWIDKRDNANGFYYWKWN